MTLRGVLAGLGALALASSLARAGETVIIGGSRAVLLRPDAARASVILMPGGDGNIGVRDNGEITRLAGNQLVRTRAAYAARGLAVLVVNADINLAAAVQYMAAIQRPVTVIATSRGTVRAAQGLARGAKPDALVLTSGALAPQSGGPANVMSILSKPALLPPTLVIHHRQDGCFATRPAGVAPFVAWAAGKATVTWLDGGISRGDPCQAFAYHGFNGIDDLVVEAAASFR